MKIPLIFILISIVATYSIPSTAKVYKCSTGNKTVFSDTPCGIDAKITHEGDNSFTSENPAGSGPIATGAQNCKIGVPKYVVSNDPESIRYGEITGGEMEVIEYEDTNIGARRYSVNVNVKNNFGAYVGEKPVICYTSQDGMRILKVDNSSFR